MSTDQQTGSVAPTITSFETLATPEDHLAGYKDVECQTRLGAKAVVRLTAPDFRKGAALGTRLALADEWDRPGIVLEACVDSQPSTLATLNQLTPASLDLLAHTAHALTFGVEYQKKMAAALAAAAQRMASKLAAAKSSSPARDTASPTSTDSASPPSSSAPSSPGKPS